MQNTPGHYEFDAFVSYHSADLEAVEKIVRHLKRSGIRLWFDKWSLEGSRSIDYDINRGLNQSRVLLLFISSESIGQSWPQFESQTVLFRDPQNSDRRFVPILLGGQEPPNSIESVLCVRWDVGNSQNLLERLVAVCTPPVEPQSSKGINVPRLSSGKRWPLSHAVSTVRHIQREAIVAMGTSDGVITWAKETKSSFRVYGHQGAVKFIDWHREKPLIVSTGVDRKTLLWDAVDGKNLKSYPETKSLVTSTRFVGDAIACGTKDGLIHLWAEHNEEVFRGHSGSVDCLDAAEKILISGGADKTIRLWDLKAGRCLRVLEGHTESVKCLAVSPNGEWILSGSADQTVRLWDLSTGQCLNIFDAHTDAIRCISWHPDGDLFVSGGGDRVIRLWSAVEARLLRVLDGNRSDVLDLSISEDAVQSVTFQEVLEWPLDRSIVGSQRDGSHGGTAIVRQPQIQYTNAKVLLIGDSGAGKTGLSRRLADGVWEETPGSTVGAWATQWSLPTVSSESAEREIWLWDFGGQADQRLIHQLYMDETALAVLVFDAQKTNVFESLEQWTRDLIRSTENPPAKLLVAGRIDASYMRVRREDIEEFVRQHDFKGFIETSARTNQGCNELREAIIQSIEWDSLPWRSSPSLFKKLKEQIVVLKDEGRILMRFNELRDALRLRLPPQEIDFTDAELKAVLSLLSGPGVVLELEFGAWVLFQPELINAYGQAVIATLRADPSELGCVNEEKVLNGDLVYGSFKRIPKDEERFVLLEMHRKLLQRGLCARELTGQEAQLVFPSYYKRNRPELVGHPAVLVSYSFDGPVDEIYSTLVVQLNYTSSFARESLWQDAAEFSTRSGPLVGVKLLRAKGGSAHLELYFARDVLLADKIIFVNYVHDHLAMRATNVIRRRHYVCQGCMNPIKDMEAVGRRVADKKMDIGCPTCDARIVLLDDLELQYSLPSYQKKVRQLEDQAWVELDNESKERALVGEVYSAVALAGHVAREKTVSDHGIDMEIEFKDSNHQASGQLLFLQLKSGDSHLRINRDGVEMFAIQNSRHAEYWARQIAPVMLVIRNSKGEIRWMEIRDILRKELEQGRRPSSIEFVGERLDSKSIASWCDRLFGGNRVR